MSKDTKRIVLFGCLMCVCSYVFMLIADIYFMANLSELTMRFTGKYLIGGWNNVDKIVLAFFPFIASIIFISMRRHDVKEYLIRIGWTFLMLIISLILGLTIALFTWQNLEGDFMLFPKYIKHQPFSFYWTIFICLGFVASMLPVLFKRKVDTYTNEPIDK